MSVSYERINWEDSPSTVTPINAENLNKMDTAISELTDAINEDVEDRIAAVEDDVTDLKADLNESVSDLKSQIDKIGNEIFDVSPNLYDADADEVGLLNVSGAVASQHTDYFTTDYIPVAYGQSVCIQDSAKVSSTNIYICEYDSSKTLVGSRQSAVIGLYITSGTYTIIGATTKYIRVSFGNAWHTNTLMISIGTEELPYSKYGQLFVSEDFVKQIKTPLYVSIASDVLRTITKYTASSDLCVAFGKHGGNNLPDFMSLSTITNDDFYPMSSYVDAVTFLDITTDWHAPFIIKAINNIDGDQPTSSHYTGGNHNYSNSGTAGYTATAVCDYLYYYVDGVKVTTFDGYCKWVEIIWSNRVQATNTKKEDGSGRYVLRENHRLTFDGTKWESYVELIPLEDITITTYYGFQAQTGTNYPNIRFIGALNRGLFTTAEAHSSGDNIANGIMIYGNDHKLEIDLDVSYDIGNRRFYSGTSGAFNSTVKVYFYLIGALATAAQNNLYAAKASYKFSHV